MMAAKPKKAPAIETHQTIAEQTEQFLKNGGEIQQIPTGASGYDHGKASKHIVLGTNVKK